MEHNAGKNGTFRAFQNSVTHWLKTCFGEPISSDPLERNRRFLEEACELVASLGMTREQALESLHDAFDKEVGEPIQEVGGAQVCLAVLCSAHNIDLAQAAREENDRIWKNMEKIRAKQRLKAEKGLSMPMEAP